MEILAVIDLSPGKSVDDLAPFHQAEDQAVRDLSRSGIIERGYLRSDRPAALLLMHVENEAAAAREVASLPAVAAGIIRLSELIPLAPHPASQRT